MKIIDISQEIYQGMPVYPGDPTFQSHRVNSFKQGGYVRGQRGDDGHPLRHAYRRADAYGAGR